MIIPLSRSQSSFDQEKNLEKYLVEACTHILLHIQTENITGEKSIQQFSGSIQWLVFYV